MLLHRLLTALVLLPILLGAIWFAPTPWLYALFCGAGALMAWEWAALAGMARKDLRWAYVSLVLAVLAALWWLPARDLMLPGLLAVAVLWWLFSVSLFPRFPGNFEARRPGRVPMGLLGLLMVSSTLLALARLHGMPDGAFKLIYFFGIVFAADTGAYLAGRNFGKRKLAPNISPGKTVEGAIGGLLLCGLWALSAGSYVFRTDSLADLGLLVALTLVVAVISIIGDLVESMFKRAAGVKDSGNLLPGHGGILDRVDSILAAAPTFVLGLLFTGL